MKKLAVLFILVFLTGCPKPRVKPETKPEQPPPTEEKKEEEKVVEEVPEIEERDEDYVLVFSPGLARSFAFMGVLQEFEKNKIRIKAVVATEIGALIASIWASSNLNKLEWEMYKFKRGTLLDSSMLRGGVARGKKVYRFLGRAVKRKDLNQMQVPVYVGSAILRDENTKFLLEHQGPSREVLRGALGIPGVLKSFRWAGTERVSSIIDTPLPVEKAKDLDLGKVICIDVMGSGDDFRPSGQTEEYLSGLMRASVKLARPELEHCDSLINIPMQGVSFLNFEKKADLVYRGRMAARRWLLDD